MTNVSNFIIGFKEGRVGEKKGTKFETLKGASEFISYTVLHVIMPGRGSLEFSILPC